jgi:hypothetical protein
MKFKSVFAELLAKGKTGPVVSCRGAAYRHFLLIRG